MRTEVNILRMRKLGAQHAAPYKGLIACLV